MKRVRASAPRGPREPEGLSKSRLPQREDCGAPKGRVLFLVGSLPAPRLRRYLEPLPLAYRLFRGQLKRCRQRWTRAFQPRRGADEPLRWSVTPAAQARATLSQMRPTRLRGSPQAPHPSPRGGTVPVTHPSWERDVPNVMEARDAGIRFQSNVIALALTLLKAEGRERR